jgi:hypothetical protein
LTSVVTGITVPKRENCTLRLKAFHSNGFRPEIYFKQMMRLKTSPIGRLSHFGTRFSQPLARFIGAE